MTAGRDLFVLQIKSAATLPSTAVNRAARVILQLRDV